MLSGLTRIMAQEGSIVTGCIRETGTDTPIEYATVTLLSSHDNKIITGCMTDSLGYFEFSAVTPGQYCIETRYVGSTPVRSHIFKITNGQSVDIGVIHISGNQVLSEVVVESRKRALTARLDKTIYHAGSDLTSTAGSASELLQNIPSLDVDIDGVVSLRGSSNVTILINGKPSAMMGMRSRGDALNQLSASDIERIEVITVPSAEYNPDGESGIINIVLKETVRKGFNGSVAANIGSYNRQNAAISATYSTPRINLFGGYTYRKDRYDRSIADHRISTDDIICQNTSGVGCPVSHTVRLGVSTAITNGDRLEIGGSYGRRLFRRNESIKSETNNFNGETVMTYSRERDAFARENIGDANVRYIHTCGNTGEWGFEYTYSCESEDEINHYTTIRSADTLLNNENVWDADYINAAKIFWKHNISAHTLLNAGYEFNHLKAQQNFHVADWDGTDFIPDRTKSSDFAHYRSLNSIYGSIETEFGKWTLQAGLRGEYAIIRNNLISTNKTQSQCYLNLFPSLHLSRPVGSNNELRLGYSARINRPQGKDMNPFAEQINPLSLEAGNPNLKPEKIHSLEIGEIWRIPSGGSLLYTVYYRYISDKITEVSRYVNAGVLLTTKDNLSSNRQAGVEFICDLPLSHWFDFNLNLNGFYNEINASRSGLGKRKSAFSWSTLLNLDFRPFRHCMIQMNVRYRSSTPVPQGKRDGDFRVNMGMKYDISRINLSVTASVTDLFDTYRKSFTLDTPELKQTVIKRRNPRIFYIGFTWQLGISGKKNDIKPEYDENL